MFCRIAEFVSLFGRSADLIWLPYKFTACYGSVHHFCCREFICECVGVISLGNLSGENDSVNVRFTSFLDM